MNHLFNTRTVILTGHDSQKKREEIRSYFHQSFDIDEQLFEAIAHKEALYLRADPLRHPLIFYYGHTAAFYINKLILAKLIDHRIDPKLESLFAIGVDEMSWDDLNQSHYNWPEAEEVKDYRNKVRKLVDKLINTLPIDLPIGWNSPFWVILMGIEHSRIHLETSSVLIRQLPLEHLKPIPGWTTCTLAGAAPENVLLEVKGGELELGKPFDYAVYGWDNEYGRYPVCVDNFKASKYLCSNGEFLSFIDDKGYQTERYWTTEGWQWNLFDGKGHPRFWIKTGSGWNLRLVFEVIPMPWNWPVEVNYLEAKAFCNWKAEKTGQPVRLPLEEEWQQLYNQANLSDQPYWDKAPGNLNLEHFQSPAPVDTFAFGPFFDLVGNVWQWTETPITGFKGFKVHPLYDDFSTPTFDLKHNLIKGGSWISTGNEATRHARYAFRRHFYQHAGFRYVESHQPVVIQQNLYETDPEIVRHCEAHYGENRLNFGNYRSDIARLCLEAMAGRPTRSALDLGCKVGRSTWELAKGFDHVTGLDFTARTLSVAIHILEEGRAVYEFPDEGELVHFREIDGTTPEFEQVRTKIEFWQADASNLKDRFSGYDLVLLNDLLDDTTDPVTVLDQMHRLINPGGLLVIASAYDWTGQQLNQGTTLGGIRVDGEPVRALEAIQTTLTDHFVLTGPPRVLVSVWPVNSRKMEVKELEITIWEKTGIQNV